MLLLYVLSLIEIALDGILVAMMIVNTAISITF